MKKIFALMLSLALLLSAAALAEDVEPATLKWEDVAEAAANVEGKFLAIGSTGLKMFIPANFVDATAETADDPTTFVKFKSAEPSECVVLGQQLPLSADDFIAKLKESGADIGNGTVNGIEIYNYEIKGENDQRALGVIIGTGDPNTILTFSYAPVDDAIFPYVGLMNASYMLMTEEELASIGQ